MIPKIGFNYYGVQKQRTQSVSMSPSFKCSRLERAAQGLAFSVMSDLLAAEKGGWDSRHNEIIDILASKAKEEYAISFDARKVWEASNVLRTTAFGSLSNRIYSAAKCFCENIISR